MDKEKTLQKIVKKAEEGGFDMKPYLPAFPNKKIVGKFLQVIYKEFIYTHEFAKAFFVKIKEPKWNGYHYVCGECGKLTCNHKNWQHHIQIMILKKDHIKYLSKFLKQ